MLIACLALYAQFNVRDRDFNNNGRDETGEYKSSGIIESYLMGFAFVSVMQTTLVAVVTEQEAKLVAVAVPAAGPSAGCRARCWIPGSRAGSSDQK